MSGGLWFTADLHLGHIKVAALRGFTAVVDHDAAVVDAWCSKIGKHDQVWVLGDLAISAPAIALSVLSDLPGEKHLIWGNHDGGHPMHRNAHRRSSKYMDVFSSASAFARRRVKGKDVLLSHFPYQRDTDGKDSDRYIEYRLPFLPQKPIPLIHGHTHSSTKVSYIEGCPQVHVGVDAWDLCPVSLKQVTELVEG